MGRVFVPDASSAQAAAGGQIDVLDCPADQMRQLVCDVTAANEATAVTSAEQLLGTWVSDDVLGIYAGIYIPVYEILEISPGAQEGEVRIEQMLYRANDPARWFGDKGNPIPPVEMPAAGRIATYGAHVAAIGRSGLLEPRAVHYFDFPVEGDRSVGLAMKARMMSFQQMGPIGTRTDGGRLVFEVPDRLTPNGQRIMTFRQRETGLPEAALQIVLLGEQSMVKFPCFLEALDSETPAFRSALGSYSKTEFLDALRDRFQKSVELSAMQAKLGTDLPEAERTELRDKIKAQLTGMQIEKDSPFMVLVQQLQTDAPFGCPSLF